MYADVFTGDIFVVFCFLMIRRPPRSTPLYSSAASDVYKRQVLQCLRRSTSRDGPIKGTSDRVDTAFLNGRAVVERDRTNELNGSTMELSLIHISEPTSISGTRMPYSA